MTNEKSRQTDDIKVYSPRHHNIGPGEIAKELTQDLYMHLDAIHHYFHNDNGEYAIAEDHDTDHGEAIAKLVAGVYNGSRVHRYAQAHVAPDYSVVRQHSSFIGGEIADGWIVQFKRWIGYYLDSTHGDDYVVIDAEDYMQDSDEGVPQPPIHPLMWMAENTKEIIDRALVNAYRHDGRGLMQFINAPDDRIINEPEGLEPGCEEDSVRLDEPKKMTKWMWESKFLADELVSIPAFQKNFHTLVILNAQKHIHTGHLNLTKLYRLFAKLGRVNTRLVFLG